jgi:putative N6-adenine-specific DNA methylase
VLSGNAELTRHLGLRASRKHVVMNGPIECRWIRYEINA